MKEELISFEMAKLAKEKGFEDICYYIYNPNEQKNEYITLPTLEQLKTWLREIHNIHIETLFIDENENFLTVITYKILGIWVSTNYGYCFEYRESFDYGLKKALELIK